MSSGREPYELPMPMPYPGGPIHSNVPVAYTDDAATKLSDRVRRRCFNCCTTDTSTWRRSNLSPGKLCNKCGLFERTHSRPRPNSSHISVVLWRLLLCALVHHRCTRQRLILFRRHLYTAAGWTWSTCRTRLASSGKHPSSDFASLFVLASTASLLGSFKFCSSVFEWLPPWIEERRRS
ncbi:hypothetical protein BDP27DRAFT_1043304 [Rhodocollybia butyracea]|uniref:GATA-type domain-containing protein n=1 Tax=Rhodocollybia butyracea TaxID=206335 RepID=A0A9P5Q6S6_9AGAR|nr:hypothetical protein BDP27DRAFT_1043304 [Rhodocollybia butyracea]